MTGYAIGVDAGQTSTKCVLATTDGHILAEGKGGGIVHLASEGGEARFAASLREACHHAWQTAGLVPQGVDAIGLGLTGVRRASPEAQIAHDLVRGIQPADHIVVESDAFAALVGARAGKPGVIVISGTGSIVLGKDARGKEARAGGWGWLVGDEGSAVAIGRAALLAAFYAFDQVGPSTLLQDRLLAHFGAASMFQVKSMIHVPEFGARGMASLAQLVSEAAQDGDTIATRIIAEAGQALAKQASAVVKNLTWDGPPPVAPIGGAFAHVKGLKGAFAESMSDLVLVRVTEPVLPPTLGALLLAIQACGVEPDQIVRQIELERGNIPVESDL